MLQTIVILKFAWFVWSFSWDKLSVDSK